MTTTRTRASLRGIRRAAASMLALALLACSLAACGRDAASPGVGDEASPAGNATAVSPAVLSPVAATEASAEDASSASPAPPASTAPAAIAGSAVRPPHLRGIALADATAAAKPLPDRTRRAGAMAPAPAGNGKVDDRCNTAADCAVKDVGSCCGYHPQCVNRDSQTHPESARADCASAGRVGICGFPMIESCECVQGHCAALPPSSNGLVQ